MADIAVLIPTYRRPERLSGLLGSILEVAAVPTHVYFVAEQDDGETLRVLNGLAGAHCTVVVGAYGGYPAAINAGYHASIEPFFLCCNDDVRFTVDWDVTALSYMVPPTQVVGINQGNGRTESFALVDRCYIEQQSGVFDKPDTVLHEYLSQFCDDEFADLAKQRGVWADAHDAIIQHEHWTFGLSQIDANYEKAQASYAQDLATYEDRRRQWAA